MCYSLAIRTQEKGEIFVLEPDLRLNAALKYEVGMGRGKNPPSCGKLTTTFFRVCLTVTIQAENEYRRPRHQDTLSFYSRT